MIIKRKKFWALLFVAFFVGMFLTYTFNSFQQYGFYGLKNIFGIKNQVVFLENPNSTSFFTESEIVFEGHEEFPTSNDDFIEPDEIQRKIVPVNDHRRSIVLNLDLMKMFLYDKGEIVDQIEIQSKGIQNSLWDTPPGQYSVQYKTDEYFSPVADVWMPHVVQFYNDFYIHGWPYDKDGELVKEDFKAGAIRLSSKDAQTVYDFSKIGSEVIVISSVPSRFKNNEIVGDYIVTDNFRYLPRLKSNSYLVADINTGQILIEEDADDEHAIASISKLMTALVSMDTQDQLEETRISGRAVNTRGDQGELTEGDRWNIHELMYPLLLESSNDAAEAISEHKDRDKFIEDMNGFAKSIGMVDTSFSDPSGLSSQNVSTAYDLLRLAHHIYSYKSYIFSISQLKDYSSKGLTWKNNNPYRNDEEYLGGKNGLTNAAGHTLLTVLDIEFKNGERRDLVFIVLQSDDEDSDTRLLQSYVERNVEFQPFEN